ncbi:hypothetical protein [Agrobacterium sp. T29]|uniref:hypothetical protein n=1 Tax=Agrobacterium sp. T29 TaxID=2580515 RepID=UPI00115E6A4C|nr:hypothetical protein [Agrobacterium sp. T29]
MDTVANRAESLFRLAYDSRKLDSEIGQADFRIRFEPLDEPAFDLEITRDSYGVSADGDFDDGDPRSIRLVEVKSCLSDVLKGDATLGNMLFEHKIRIPGYRNKEPLIGHFSRFMRLAVWAAIPGAGILKPAR